MARRACNKAPRVIAVSKYVHDFLIEKWLIYLGKIGIVSHGVDLPPNTDISLAPSSLKNFENIPFVLTAGSLRPARELEDIINALGYLYCNGYKYHLVINGDIDSR